MKKLYFILFVLSLFFLGNCSKDVEIPKSIQTPDTIASHDIIPDTSFNATGPWICCPPYFRCRDSSCFYPLDVDADGVTDFNLFSQVSFVDYGGPTNQNKEQYNCGISSINATDGAFSTHILGPCVTTNIDSTGNIIDNTLYYYNNSYIYFLYPGIGYYATNNTDKYIGYKNP